MAKIRRTIRKLKPVAETPIEEQLWPIYVALLLFGGLLCGMVLAYLRFDDPWYRNALLWLLVVPVLIGSAMAALYFVNTRYMRRAVQLAMVLSIILHFLVFWRMYYIHLMADSGLKRDRGVAKKPEEKPIQITIERPVLVPDERRDFERPVETPDPEPTQPEEIDRSQPEPEPQETPDPARPEPKDEPQVKPEPAVANRAASGQTAPRFSDVPSRLSRQTSQARPTTNRSADAPQVAARTETSQNQPSATVAKTASQSPAEARKVDEPTTVEPKTDAQVARREERQEPTPESPASATVQRQNTRAAIAPSTAVAQAELPSATKATDESEVTPRTVSPDKRPTATTEVAQQTQEPTPETPTEVKTEVQRRALQAEEAPTVAQNQQTVPNPRRRETTRPSVSTVASTTATDDTPQQTAQTQEVTRPTTTSVARATENPSATQGARAAEVSPSPATEPNTTSVARRTTTQPSPSEATNTAAVTLPRRASSNPGIASASETAQVAAAAASSNAAEGELSPSSVAVRKSETESPESAPAAGAPAAASVTGVTESSTSTLASRRSQSENAPLPTDNAVAAARGRSSSPQALNVNSVADASTSRVGATNAADATAVGPASAQVARQETSTPGATASRQPLPSESLSPSTQVASSGSQRAAVASLPTVNPSATPTASPQRAMSASQSIASPTRAESPSMVATTTGQGDPSAQPAKMALTKSLTGVAGVGQSPNLDRSLPAADSPSLVASGSARREMATQNMPEGPALSPSSTAIAGRSRATASAPSSTLRAQELENASQAGAQQLAQVDAAAGASLQRQSSNAADGPVTASPGQVEVDIGPTQTIADSGASSRASGGGQPTINTQTQSTQLARREVGGSTAAALATDTKADMPTAPAGSGGGAPKSLDVNTEATAIARTQAGGESPVTGGPAAASERGPATEVSAAAIVGEAPLARNSDANPGGAPQAAGQPEVASTSDAARRVARAAGGAPQLAVGGPVKADTINLPQGDGGASGGSAEPAATSVARSGGAGESAASAPAAQLATASTGGVVTAAQVGRAEAVESAPGAPAIGGGEAASQPRRSTGPALAANTKADVPSIMGAPASGGAEDGTPLASAGVEVAKAGGARSAGAVDSAASVAAGEPNVAGGTVATGVALAQRASGSAAGDAPAATGATGAGTLGRRQAKVEVAGGSTAAEILEAGAQLARSDGDNPLAGMDRGAMTRQEVTGAVPVNVPADEGPGGLGVEVAMDVGINSRRASADSMQVQVRDARFIRQKVGGELNINNSAIVAAEGFRRRGPDGRGGSASTSPQTEESVELGLVYLARHQLEDGSWRLQGHDPNDSQLLVSDTAATALAVLAFQGAGYNHREHKYQDVVRGGLEYLIKNQQKSGDLFVRADDRSNASVWLYSHALAALALSEAYGMTGDPELREPAQKAVDFIIKAQHKDRGGWRYVPQAGSDTSVTGWMMMALKSAETANLDVPADTYAKIRRWLDASDGGDGREHLFRYDPWAPDTPTQRHGRLPSKTMTSVGLLMRLYLGWQKESPEMQRGADYLLANPPEVGTVRPRLIAQTPRDTYYWYYATQVMWHMKGEHWERWQASIHPLLLNTQIKEGDLAGSWDPNNPVPDRWGPTAGRLYVTTMNLLSLEVQYRYLPIHEVGNK